MSEFIPEDIYFKYGIGIPMLYYIIFGFFLVYFNSLYTVILHATMFIASIVTFAIISQQDKRKYRYLINISILIFELCLYNTVVLVGILCFVN
jgi:hypothetical protein